jgi:hypothetical protein
MDCHEAKDRLTEGRATAALDRHLARCEDCAAFRREVASGGRELADAYLAAPPSPGFEERISARLREREISVRPGVGGRLVRLLLPAAVVLLAVVVWQAATPEPAPPIAPPPIEEPKPVAQMVPTESLRENLLYVSIHRGASENPTVLSLSFAGEERSVRLDGDTEGEIFRSFALGARTADILIGEEIPGREICRVIETLEKAGFSYYLTRTKSRP